GILEDEGGNLWLSTSNGISKFDPAGASFRNYTISDGLQSNSFSTGAYYKNNRGEMFFGGSNGFNIFTPEEVIDNSAVPVIVLTSLTQSGQEIELDSALEYLWEVTFYRPDSFFEFEFAALNYTQTEKNQYAYMLEGFDKDWVYIGNKRYGRYTNLPGGSYTLRLKGSNNDGIWNEEGAAIQVSIVPTIWERWWFWVVIAIALGGGVYGSYRLRVRSLETRSKQLEIQVGDRTEELSRTNLRLESEIKERKRAEEALAQKAAEAAVTEERTRLARDLHDSVTQSLFGVTLFADAAQRMLASGDTDTAADNMRELRDTAKDALGEMRRLVFELRPPILEEEGLAAALQTRLEAVEKRIGLNTEYTMKTEGRLAPEIEEGLYRIAQEALNNILNHAQANHLNIVLSQNDAIVTLEIADDGIGFDPNEVDKMGGLGLISMKERANKLGGQLSVDSKPGEGTNIRVEVKG
ncbi:histidine kinase, partial [Chloroflexota bacterium]